MKTTHAGAAQKCQNEPSGYAIAYTHFPWQRMASTWGKHVVVLDAKDWYFVTE